MKITDDIINHISFNIWLYVNSLSQIGFGCSRCLEKYGTLDKFDKC